MSIAGFLSKKIDGRSFSELTQKKAMAPRCHSAIVITLLIIFKEQKVLELYIAIYFYYAPLWFRCAETLFEILFFYAAAISGLQQKVRS